MKYGWFGLLLCAFFSISQCNPVDFKEEKQPFTIEELMLGQLAITSFSGKWISDNEIEYLDQSTKDVKVFNVAKNQTNVVLKASVLKKYNTTQYEFSPDRKFVLLSYDEKKNFRQSNIVKYVVYSIEDGHFDDKTKDWCSKLYGAHSSVPKKYYGNNEYLQVAEWAPKNHILVFIKDNDIYLVRNISAKMEATRITNDGNPGSVFNGITDWVYKEEILSSGKGFWFSPNADQLAFITFFDSKVSKVAITAYGEPGDIKDQYSKQIEISYPKSGSTNPTYELRHVFFNDTQKVRVLSKCGPGKEIFNDLKWTKNDEVVYVETNRVQNESITTFCKISLEGHCQSSFREKNSKGWANTNLPIVSKNGDRLLRIEGVPVDKFGKFKQLVIYYSDKTNYSLTGGLTEVLKVVHWNENKKIIYYSRTEENSATSTQIYAIGESKDSKPVCLTCEIKSPEGRNCKEASAVFSKESSYVIINCNGPDPKVVYLYQNTQPLGKPLVILEDNAKLRSQLKKKIFPEVMNLTVEVPGPFKADVRLLLPPKLDRSGKTKYPLVIYVYGGPASKNINDAFKLDWGLYLSTNLSIIYGIIDGRNTLRKGENMLFAGYRALGTLEMEDQINVTSSLIKMFPFIDSSKTGIWGWSYGGYATIKILEMDTRNVFKNGIAVAPVADWIYYDSVYSERYLGLPQENQKGYERASVLKDVSNLRNKELFIIHGNADDNVHYQNAMMIVKQLERNTIRFGMLSYPDEDHTLRNVRKHLYYTMNRFWRKVYKLPL